MIIECGDTIGFDKENTYYGKIIDHICLSNDEINVLMETLKEKGIDIAKFDSLIFLKEKKVKQ